MNWRFHIELITLWHNSALCRIWWYDIFNSQSYWRPLRELNNKLTKQVKYSKEEENIPKPNYLHPNVNAWLCIIASAIYHQVRAISYQAFSSSRMSHFLFLRIMSMTISQDREWTDWIITRITYNVSERILNISENSKDATTVDETECEGYTYVALSQWKFSCAALALLSVIFTLHKHIF